MIITDEVIEMDETILQAIRNEVSAAVSALNQRIAELEHRVAELEAVVARQPIG